MRHIIVGFDGSPIATAALHWAVSEARLHGADVVALAVLDDRWALDPDLPPDRVPSVLDDLSDAVTAAADGVPVTLRHALGSAAQELVAAGRNADLLVVGSHGRDRFPGTLLGPVSRATLHHAPCPVVVLQPDAATTGDGRVVVGIDGSDLSSRALLTAATEARRRGALLQAVHAVRWDRIGAELLTPTDEQLVEWGQGLVDMQLDSVGVEAQPVIVPGHAGDILVKHSRTADLLVLGSKGHNPLTGLLLGSTSDYCARRASCPVMIVPPDGAIPAGPHPPGHSPSTTGSS